jgi:tRNA G10  N-methylase Trm11
MTTFLTILGRQPALSLAELEGFFGNEAISRSSTTSALVEADHLAIERLGGSIKAGRVVLTLPNDDWSSVKRNITKHYLESWKQLERKQTIGVSVYDWNISKKLPTQLLLGIKSELKPHGVSIRTIPNTELALNTATSHHNKLGLSENKTELLIVRGFNGQIIVAESIGAQNITALAARDQARPKTDAFVGMLPPKLAQMMLNMSGITKGRVLDPFCGTGVVLQEALLNGLDAYGTDLSEKMVEYSKVNLEWLTEKYRLTESHTVHEGDAMNTTWQAPIDAVVAETYLGQPFSAPPSPNKLKEVTRICDFIITDFLKNIKPQLEPGTPLILAVPAWRNTQGDFTHLDVIGKLGSLGYTHRQLRHVKSADLLYYRENQVVAREILLLTA